MSSIHILHLISLMAYKKVIPLYFWMYHWFSSCHVFDNWDEHRRMGPVHGAGGGIFLLNHKFMPELCTFWPARLEFFHSSIGVGVREIIQVTRDKIFCNKQPKKEGLVWIFARILPKYMYCLILCEYYPNFAQIRYIGKIWGGGHSIPPPPPISYAYGNEQKPTIFVTLISSLYHCSMLPMYEDCIILLKCLLVNVSLYALHRLNNDINLIHLNFNLAGKQSLSEEYWKLT